jgi:hypothetical protein
LTAYARQDDIEEPTHAAAERGGGHWPVEYFDVQAHEGQIVLKPVRIERGNAVRDKLAAQNLNETDLCDAVTWARATGPKSRLSASPAVPPKPSRRG